MSFLSKVMRVALRVTGAERALAVDAALSVVDSHDLQIEELDAPVVECIQHAIKDNAPVVTDNYTLTVDPAEMPHTNQVLPALRSIVVIPVAGHGAIYLDERIHDGIVPREIVARLSGVINYVVENRQLEREEDELVALFEQLD